MASENCLSKIIPGVADSGVMVEVGVLKASNLLALAKRFPMMKFIGIDSYEAYTDSLHGGYTITAEMSAANLETARRRIAKSEAASRIELRVVRSDLAATEMEDCSVDLVYLDKNFTFAEQLDDVSQWYPKVRDGGILAGHEAYTPEIMKATQEALTAMGVSSNIEVVDGEVWYIIKRLHFWRVHG
jgi:vacuolar-type H+-ATPase catalytic subunit A/Vma1